MLCYILCYLSRVFCADLFFYTALTDWSQNTFASAYPVSYIVKNNLEGRPFAGNAFNDEDLKVSSV